MSKRKNVKKKYFVLFLYGASKEKEYMEPPTCLCFFLNTCPKEKKSSTGENSDKSLAKATVILRR